jgi:hypothetical protein
MSDGRIIKNPHYPTVPPVRQCTAVRGQGTAGHPCTGPIYSLIGDAEALAFLNEPEKYPDIFKSRQKG